MSFETIEYSVCEDCLMFLAYGGEELEDGTTQNISEAITRELNGRSGGFHTGVEPTEEDPDGTGYEEFSWSECELCRSSLGGSRHGATLLLQEDS